MKELKTTAYRPRSVLLGSREQLCVHPEVSKLKGGLQNRRCGVLTANHGCRYVCMWVLGGKRDRVPPPPPLFQSIPADPYTTRHLCNACNNRFKNNLDAYQADHVGAAPEVLDIEELVELGKGRQVCGWVCWWGWVVFVCFGGMDGLEYGR